MTAKSKTSAIIFLLSLFLLGSPLALADKIKIGMALPLSGGPSFQGQHTLNGAKLYLEENPNFAQKVEMLVEDVTANTASSVTPLIQH